MKPLAKIALSTALFTLSPLAAFAAAHSASPVASVEAADKVKGEVRKVDRDAKKITIKHEELKNLDMPAMTMVFQVKDTAMLEKIKKGDKVQFVAEKVGGQFTVTDIDVQQ